MIDARQPFDLRQNEDFIFANEPWWMANHLLTTFGATLVLGMTVAAYALLLMGMVHVAQAWVGQ